MPTGYTAGILDGTTATFEDFAKLCIRNFGAAMHMRETSLNEPYEPRIPSDYHLKQIENIEAQIEIIDGLSDDQLRERFIAQANADLKEYSEANKKGIHNEFRLKEFLKKAKSFEPPTPEHENYKKFLIDQIQSTIDFDGRSDYYDREATRLMSEIKNFNPMHYKIERLATLRKNLEYHKDNYQKEVIRCKEANEWVQAILDAL